MFSTGRKNVMKLVQILVTIRALCCLQGITADDASVAADAIAKPRRNLRDGNVPVMHTFYEPITAQRGFLGAKEPKMLKLWKEEWQAAGFETKILTLKDAKKHPYFPIMEQVVSEIFPNDDYNKYCYYRYLAMAIAGGGWMADMDTFPTNFPMEEGLILPNNGKFTSFQSHVPSLISAGANEWTRISKFLVEAIPISNQEFKSDMMILYDLRLRENPFIDFRWGDSVENPDKIWKPGHVVDCYEMNHSRAIHMSHKHLFMVLEMKIFPVPTLHEYHLTEDERAEGAREIMDQWRAQDKCGYIPTVA